MKILGVVQWVTRDKGGNPIAGVRPLIELQGGTYRDINAIDEFPSQGQVFWWNAQGVTENSLVTFRPEENDGQKDEYKVADARPAYEVLDFRHFGATEDVRAALATGIRLTGQSGTFRAFAWCKPDVLIGPVELTHATDGTVKLSGVGRHHLPVFSGAQIHSIIVDRHERLLRIDETAPSSSVDWDDDVVVLRRALEATVRVAREAGRETGETKKKIEEAVRTLIARGIGSDAQLDRYRLERALAMLKNTEVIEFRASELTELLRGHPAIKASLEELSAKVRVDVEESARVELEEKLQRERAALEAVTEAHVQKQNELDTCELELREAQRNLSELQNLASNVASEAEAAVNARVLAAIDRPLELLAEVSVLRPLLGLGAKLSTDATTLETPARINWLSSRGDGIDDKASLRRALTSAARARGVDPSLMLRIHAATVSGLMPVTLGSSALSALVAYADSACGGRILVIHVAPSAIQPRDLDAMPSRGFTTAGVAAKDVDGISLVLLEGANRSPLEASLLPLLQTTDAGLSPLSSARGLRLAATFVIGATTVPVTSQIWNYAVAIYPESDSLAVRTSIKPSDVCLSSDLFAQGDVPTEVIDALIDNWPDCDELRPAMVRFGSALTRFYDEEPRVSDALLHGLVLPYIVTSLTSEEQASALNKAGDADGILAAALRRMRKSLC